MAEREKPLIWCVEDEQSIRTILLYTLDSTGFAGRGFADGAEFRQALAVEQPDLILLDIMLPDEDGLSLLHGLKADPKTRDIPVLMTTARGLEADIIQALEAGADDYLVKPFGMMEMTARIRAVLRRSQGSRSQSQLCWGPIALERKTHRVYVNGDPVELTRKEYGLLLQLLESQGAVISREELLKAVWNADFLGESRTVDVHIGSLRQKLGSAGSLIETVRGIGYRLKTLP